MAQLTEIPTSEVIELARTYLNGWSGLALPDDIANEVLKRLDIALAAVRQATKERDELKRKFEALAVENISMRNSIAAINSSAEEAEYDGYLTFVVNPDDIHAAVDLIESETPATDAALAKVRGRAQLDLCEYLSEVFRSIERKGGEFSAGAAGALAVVDSRVSWIEMVPYPAGHWFNKTAILEMLANAGITIQGDE